MRITYSSRQSTMNQPGKAANPARGQLNRENGYFFPAYVQFAPENLVSRDAGFGHPVPRRQPVHSPLYTSTYQYSAA